MLVIFDVSDETRVKEFGLKSMWRSPNGTIRNILNGLCTGQLSKFSACVLICMHPYDCAIFLSSYF